jgi:hypothetical protein
MQLFYFLLKAGRQTIPDPEGQELADEVAARKHAMAVAQQLMQHRENDTRTWRIQVCDDYLRPMFDVHFVDADETINQYPLTVKASIENVARTAAAFNDVFENVRATLAEVRATIEHANRVLASIPRARL